MPKDKIYPGREMIKVLVEAGIINEWAQRVVIDVSLDDIPRVYVEQIGGKTLIDVIPKVTGVTVTPLMVVKGEEKEESNED